MDYFPPPVNKGKCMHGWGRRVSVTVVYRKVGHPSRRYGRVTGCGRKQGLLSVQHSSLTLKHRCPQNLKPTTYHALKSHLLCLRCECLGLRTCDLIRASKNIAWIGPFFACVGGRSHVLASRRLSFLSVASTLQPNGSFSGTVLLKVFMETLCDSCCHDSFGKQYVPSPDLYPRGKEIMLRRWDDRDKSAESPVGTWVSSVKYEVERHL